MHAHGLAETAGGFDVDAANFGHDHPLARPVTWFAAWIVLVLFVGAFIRHPANPNFRVICNVFAAMRPIQVGGNGDSGRRALVPNLNRSGAAGSDRTIRLGFASEPLAADHFVAVGFWIELDFEPFAWDAEICLFAIVGQNLDVALDVLLGTAVEIDVVAASRLARQQCTGQLDQFDGLFGAGRFEDRWPMQLRVVARMLIHLALYLAIDAIDGFR